MLLEYPAELAPRRRHPAPAIPGLPIAGAMLLAPHWQRRRAGLLSGQIPSGSASPLPSGLLAQLRGPLTPKWSTSSTRRRTATAS